jgi:hypothetical protein
VPLLPLLLRGIMVIMRKMVFIFIFTNAVLLVNAQTVQDNYFSHPIHSKFYGYYLPLDFVNSFEKTKDFLLSKEFIKKYECFYLRIDKNGIWVEKQTDAVEDGYHEKLIQTQDGLRDYQFEIGNNNDITVINKNGEKYKKISNDYNYYIPAIDNYLGRIVLHDIINNGDIILDNDIITVPSLDYEKFIIKTWGVTDLVYKDANINGHGLYLDGFYNRGLNVLWKLTTMNIQYLKK